jgi:hypothetical protein
MFFKSTAKLSLARTWHSRNFFSRETSEIETLEGPKTSKGGYSSLRFYHKWLGVDRTYPEVTLENHVLQAKPAEKYQGVT